MIRRERLLAVAWLAAGVFACSEVLCADPAYADSMRCKEQLISTGYRSYEVSSVCGPPDSVDQRVERRQVRRRIRSPCAPGSRALCETEVDTTVDVPIEVWTYDFGPQRFLEYVTFEQGVVVKIETGDYGHKQSQ